MDKQIILFLYSNTGGGHLASGKAIMEALIESSSNEHEYVFLDFIEATSRYMNMYAKLYGPLIKYTPWIYGFFYNILNKDLPLALWEKMGHVFMNKKLTQAIIDSKANIIVNVHPEASYLASRVIRKNQLNIPFVVVVTDLINYHKSWLGKTPYNSIEDTLTEAIVPTKEAYDLALFYKCPAHKIKQISLPLRKQFDETSTETEVDRPFTVLIMGGGDGAGNIKKIVQQMKIQNFKGRLRIITGNNHLLRNQLEKISAGNINPHLQIEIFGYVSEVRKLMDNADILITKAGPGSIAEALICRLPMILNYWVPGQEAGNCRYVQDNGLGYCITKEVDIVKKIIHLQHDPRELLSLRKKIESINFVNGSQEIAKRILYYLGNP